MPNPKGKPKGGNKLKGQNRRNNRRYQTATSNVQLQDQGQIDLLNQQLQQAQQDFQRERQGARSIYGGYQDELADVPQPGFGQVGQDLQAALSSVAPMFSGDEYMPGAEIGAGQNLGLAFGEAGSTMLANMQAREGMARSSAGREGALAGRYAQDALLQRMQDTMQGYNNQLGQVRADDPWQIQQEVGNLREQALTGQLTRSKLESDRAFSQWLQDYLGGGASRGYDGRGNRDGGGGGGGGGGGVDTTGYGTAPQPSPGPNAVDPNNIGLPPQPGQPGYDRPLSNVQKWQAGSMPWSDLHRPARRYIRQHELQRQNPPVMSAAPPPPPPLDSLYGDWTQPLPPESLYGSW